MCNYRVYIFLGCGHSTFSSTPVSYCTNAISPAGSKTQEDMWPALHTSGVNITSAGLAIDLKAGSQLGVVKTLRNSILSNQEASNNTREQRRPDNSASERNKEIQPCGEGRVHPLHTRRLECMCSSCAQERDERLRSFELILGETKIDPQRWQWNYREGG
jgi:hypothetical protein